MPQSQANRTKFAGTIEARRLAELARAAGLGDSPDDALRGHQEAIVLLGSEEETPLLADVLRWQGSVLRDRGRTSEAEPLYQRSLQLSTKLEYPAGRAHAINCLASLAQRRGDLSVAANLMTDSLALAQECGESRLVGMLQQNLGIVADIRGNPAAARAHYLVALRTFEATNDLQPMCWVMNNLGYLNVKEERFEEAEAVFERALGIARARGDLMAEGILEENRAELELLRDNVEGSHASIARALAIAEQRGDNVRRAAALKLGGAYERLMGRPSEGADTLRHALTLSAVGEDALLGAEIFYQFGMALHASGDVVMAKEVWKTALEAFERIAARQWAGRVRQRLIFGASSRYL